MGSGVNEYDETHGWSAWMAFGVNLATNCSNENIEATGIESNADDSTDEVLGEERGEHVVGEATPDVDGTNEVMLYEEIVWEARVDHDACANEDDDANCCDEVLREECGEHVMGEATSDDDGTNEVLLYEETVQEARVDHDVDNCVNGDYDANCWDEVLGDECGEHVVGEATPDDEVTNEVLLYEEIVWEARVDHDACVNEDDDANCCDEVLREECGEHVVGEATPDDGGTNEVLLYEETVLEARVDHHVNNCVNEDADANCCDEVLGEEMG